MIRAAIVGLGRWGRALVRSVQDEGGHRSDDIGFVLAHTRTRASAEEFCREHGLTLVDSYDRILSDPHVDAVVLAHSAQPTRAADHRGRRCR